MHLFLNREERKVLLLWGLALDTEVCLSGHFFNCYFREMQRDSFCLCKGWAVSIQSWNGQGDHTLASTLY